MRTISPKRGNLVLSFSFPGCFHWVRRAARYIWVYSSISWGWLGRTDSANFRKVAKWGVREGWGVTNKPSTRQKSPKEMRRGNQRFEKVSKVKNILLTSHTSPMASKEWYLYQYLKELVYIICWFKTYKWHWKSRSCHLLGKAAQYLWSSSEVGIEYFRQKVWKEK